MSAVDVVHGHSRACWDAAAVAIGNFDGVHVGHRALIARREAARAARRRADVRSAPVGTITPRGAPAMLASLARRIELLADAGADAVVVEPFTRELAALAPDAFIHDIVLDGLRATAIVVGYDFCYGANRAGTIETLRAHARVPVEVVPPVEVGGEVASSSRIRHYLTTGDVVAAARLLGRPWDVDGIVVHGAKRGRAIGVPTANIAVIGDLPLRPGIYAVTLDGMPAVASLGTNPTFVEDGRLVLEVHVLDFDGDLYDREVRVTVNFRLRDEVRFSSVDALIEQIRADIDEARRLFKT